MSKLINNQIEEPAPEGSKTSSKTKINPLSLKFYHKFYPQTRSTDWNNWTWQLQNTISNIIHLKKYFKLIPDEEKAFKMIQNFNFRITPYYLSLLDPGNPDQALRRTTIPRLAENITSPGESEDPLNEDHTSPVEGIVHRYPDRVLFLVTNFCSVRCRYCTRSRMIENDKQYSFNINKWKKSIDYIRQNSNIRDVLISGGDPLTLNDDKIEWLLSNLRQIKHIEIIRIGTKVPVVLPQRITPALIKILKKYHPLWMSIHFTHPDEITLEVQNACNALANAGIPLGSQTVLLKDINDKVDIMKKLFHLLLQIRVKPYYIYQCDPIIGSKHFRTPVATGFEIIQGLRGYTTGYAVPNYVIDAPGGGGKIPLLPEYYLGSENGEVILKNYEGKIYKYPDFE